MSKKTLKRPKETTKAPKRTQKTPKYSKYIPKYIDNKKPNNTNRPKRCKAKKDQTNKQKTIHKIK